MAAAVGDLALTFVGQGAHYWAGFRDEPNEASPWFNHVLRHHPFAAMAAGAGWVLVFSVLILVLPRRLSLWVWLGVVMGHTWGVTTWVRILWPDPSYGICLGLWVAVAGVAAVTWDGGAGERGDVRGVA